MPFGIQVLARCLQLSAHTPPCVPQAYTRKLYGSALAVLMPPPPAADQAASPANKGGTGRAATAQTDPETAIRQNYVRLAARLWAEHNVMYPFRVYASLCAGLPHQDSFRPVHSLLQSPGGWAEHLWFETLYTITKGHANPYNKQKLTLTITNTRPNTRRCLCSSVCCPALGAQLLPTIHQTRGEHR